MQAARYSSEEKNLRAQESEQKNELKADDLWESSLLQPLVFPPILRNIDNIVFLYVVIRDLP